MGQSTDHALLSPSGASRWMACTPSARFEQQFPDSSGAAAREGTLAHEIGELKVRYYADWIQNKVYGAEFDRIVAEDGKGEKFYDNAMGGYTMDYATFVMEKFAEAQVITPHAELFVESWLDLSKYIVEDGGTRDIAIVCNTKLIIIDLKYGKGVEVSAFENKQMKIYALGSLDEFDSIYDIEEVEMVIYQPRIDNISSWTASVKDLREWAKDELIPKAALAFKGEGDFKPGLHCGFCRGKNRCKALADYNLEILQYEFRDSNLLEDGQISDILNREKMLTNWLTGITEYALIQATTHGKKWPGFKLVEGRSNRVFTDPKKVVELVTTSAGIPEDAMYNKKLIALGDVEALLGGKKAFNALLGEYVLKPKGKPALVPVTDKREEWSSADNATDDFAEIE